MTRKRIIVGVAGGIAAYKACSVVRQLTEAGHQVRVDPHRVRAAIRRRRHLRGAVGNPVHTGVFDDVHEVPHVRIGQEADLVVVAPATADLLARAVAGRADDLLTATLLTARCPVLFAPAMHTEMWLHPATVENVATLRHRGAVVLEPASGRLTGADTGAGRLPEAEEITTLAQLLLERGDALPHDLAGVKVLVTAGGTREPIDPVRFIGNRSPASRATRWPGWPPSAAPRCTLIAGNTAGLADPAGVEVVHIGSASPTSRRGVQARPDANVLVMAAAVADFRPGARCNHQDQEGRRQRAEHDRPHPQRRRAGRRGALARRRPAAQYAGDRRVRRRDRRRQRRRAVSRPRQTRRKGCDLLVVNAVGEAAHSRWTTTTDGCWPPTAPRPRWSTVRRHLMASRIVDAIVAFLHKRRVTGRRTACAKGCADGGARLGATSTDDMLR